MAEEGVSLSIVAWDLIVCFLLLNVTAFCTPAYHWKGDGIHSEYMLNYLKIFTPSKKVSEAKYTAQESKSDLLYCPRKKLASFFISSRSLFSILDCNQTPIISEIQTACLKNYKKLEVLYHISSPFCKEMQQHSIFTRDQCTVVAMRAYHSTVMWITATISSKTCHLKWN